MVVVEPRTERVGSLVCKQKRMGYAIAGFEIIPARDAGISRSRYADSLLCRMVVAHCTQ